MSDLETVRRSVLTTRKVDGDVAALDRIEAEVERLREERQHVLDEAARRGDTITHLRAEGERLRAENDAIDRNWTLQENELQELRGEVEQLRAALDRIAAQPSIEEPQMLPTAKDIARAALAGAKV